MQNKLASVILPIYNDEKYIIGMLESINQQTYGPIEILVIDDSSKDKSLELIRGWKKNLREDISIMVYENHINNGLTKNINLGIAEAKGDYILLADHDDIWSKVKIEKQIDFLEDNKDYICCFCDRRLIDEKGNEIFKSEYELIKYELFSAGLHEMAERKAKFSSNVMCFRNDKEIINKVFPMPENVIEHDFYIATLFSCCSRIAYIHEALIDYRIHSGNLSGNYFGIVNMNKESFIRSRNYQKQRYKKIKSIDKGIIETGLKNKFNIIINIKYSLGIKHELLDLLPDSIYYYLYCKLKR